MNFWTVALIGFSVPLVLRLLAHSAAKPGTKGTLAYSVTLRRLALSIAIVPPLLLGSLMAWHPPRSGVLGAILFIVLFFLALASPLLLEFHRVRYTFDGDAIRIRTPWSRNRSLRWRDITTMEWRSTLKWFDLLDGTTVLHISPLLTGLDDFAKQCAKSTPKEVREADAEVLAVLRLMAAGRGSDLTFAPGRPSSL